MSAVAIIAILDVLFVILLVLGFVGGFCRGVKRSSLEFGLAFAGILICGFITPVVTNAILGITVTANGVSTSLKDYFVNIMAENETLGTLLESSPTMGGLLQNIPSVLFCSVVFLALNLVMRLVMYIIYKIISVCAFKSKKKEKELGLKRNRWVGGAIGTLKMFMVVLVIFMPLVSVVRIVDSALPEQAAQVSAATIIEGDGNDNSNSGNQDPIDQITSSLPPIVKNIVHGINKSAFSVVGGCVGLDDYIFDNISQFKLNGQNVQIRKEMSGMLSIYNDLSLIYTNPQSIKDMDWAKIDGIYNMVSSSGFYKGAVLNIVGEMIDNYPKIISLFPDQLSQFEQIFESIKNGMGENANYVEYFSNDVDNFYKAISALGKSGYLDKVINVQGMDAAEAVTILSTQHEEAMTKAISGVIDMNLIQDALSPTLDFAISKLDNSKLTNILKNANTEITNWDGLKTQIKTLLVDFGEVNNLIKDQDGDVNLNISNVIADAKLALKLNKNVEQILSRFGEMLDTADTMDIMVDNQGNKILPQVLKEFGVEDLLVVNGREDITSYKGLFTFVAPAANNLISLNLYDTVANGADFNKLLKIFSGKLVSDMKVVDSVKTYSTFMIDTLLPLYRVKAFRNYAFNPIIEKSKGTGVIDFSLLEVYDDVEKTQYNFDASYANWQFDLAQITQVITELENKMYDETANKTCLDYILAGGDLNNVVNILSAEEKALIVDPILKAKSTAPLKAQLAKAVVESYVSGEAAEALTDVIINGLEDPETLDKVTSVIKDNEENIVKVLDKADEYGVTIELSDEAKAKLEKNLDSLTDVGNDTIEKLKNFFGIIGENN